jgi:hypothetical protein
MQKRRVTLIHINQPTQQYINNTMNIIQIFKHFNINKCFEFPFGTLKGIFLRRSLYFTNQLYNWKDFIRQGIIF